MSESRATPLTVAQLNVPDRIATTGVLLQCQPGDILGWYTAKQLLSMRRVFIENADEHLMTALALLAGQREWTYADGTVPARAPIRLFPIDPFGHWVVQLAADADWIGWMRDEGKNHWVRSVACEQLHVDLGQVIHLRSVIIGWLLSLRQMLGDSVIDLMNVDGRAMTVLQQMRLGSIFTVDGMDSGFGSSGVRASQSGLRP